MRHYSFLLMGLFISSMAGAAVTCSNSVINQSNPIAVHIDCAPVFVEDVNIPAGTFPPDFIASEYARAQAYQANIATMPAVGASITPTASPGPTVNLFAVQEAQFLSNFSRLRQYKEAINNGLITTADASYTALLASTTSQYAVIKDTVTALMPMAP